MAHALRRNDDIDPLWDHLTQARLHLTTFCTQRDPDGDGVRTGFTDRVAAAAALHRVVVFDHPALIRAYPEGFHDGVFVFLPSRFGLNLLLDHEPHQAPAIQRWLHQHLRDLVAVTVGDARDPDVTHVPRAQMQQWLREHGLTRPEMGFFLDSALAPLLRAWYAAPSLDVRKAFRLVQVDANKVLERALAHDAWDHPLVSLAHVAQGNLLAEQAGRSMNVAATAQDLQSDLPGAGDAWSAHYNGGEPFLQSMMAGQVSNVVRTLGLPYEALEMFMKAASDHPSFSLAGRRALINALSGYMGVAPVQHAAMMAAEMVDEESLWATPDQEPSLPLQAPHVR